MCIVVLRFPRFLWCAIKTRMNTELEDFVHVAVRIRPLLKQAPFCLELMNRDAPIIYIPDRAKAYTFDNVFNENANQETVYETMVKPLVNKVKDGYNCTVFAYGQTGTGKTHTIGSNPNAEDVGFIPRALEDFFSHEISEIYSESEISISFYEIYNEKVLDLLENSKAPLPIKEFRVQGLTEMPVKNPYEATKFLERGSRNRHVSETKQNSNSSRSHAIFTIRCITKYENHETVAKLNLVDLAGSESVKKTGNQGSRFSEGVHINKGLLCIGQVMNALSRNNCFVPYRQSVITTILQDSLNKTNFVSLVACVSPQVDDIHETVHTLDFASRTKQLKNKPELNKFKNENPQLFYKSVTKSAVKCTPRKEVNPSHPTLSAKRRLAEREPNFLPANTMDSCKGSFYRDLGNLSTSTEISPVCSTPFLGNKENMPSFPWHQLEETIASIVRREVQELQASQTTIMSNIKKVLQKEMEETSARKNVDFSSPLADSLNDGKTFRVPALPKRRRGKVAITSSPNKSPIQPRRSTRLSLKKIHAGLDGSLKSSASFFESTPDVKCDRRRSVRLLEKATAEMPTPLPRMRIGAKSENVDYCRNTPATPVPAPRTKVTKGSPRTTHRNNVLNILNSGNEKRLQTLATIGMKNASLICTYRSINGSFTQIADLKKLPFWREKAYERFCKSNLLQ